MNAHPERWSNQVLSSNAELTLGGLLTAGVVFALLVIGFVQESGSLFLLGFSLFVALLVIRIAGKANLKALSLIVKGANTVMAGKNQRFQMHLKNRSRFQNSYLVTCVLHFAGEISFSENFLQIPKESIVFKELESKIHGRGSKPEHLVQFDSLFPFGLFRFSKRMKIASHLEVLAKERVPNDLQVLDIYLADAVSEFTNRLGDGGDWRDLSEWSVGDSLKNVAWAQSAKSLARSGTLISRRYEPPESASGKFFVIFHSSGGAGKMINHSRFETALSLMLGAAAYARRSSFETVVTGDVFEWKQYSVDDDFSMGRLRRLVSRVNRSQKSEQHDVENQLAALDDSSRVVLISDLPTENWIDGFKTKFRGFHVVEIERYTAEKPKILTTKVG